MVLQHDGGVERWQEGPNLTLLIRSDYSSHSGSSIHVLQDEWVQDGTPVVHEVLLSPVAEQDLEQELGQELEQMSGTSTAQMDQSDEAQAEQHSSCGEAQAPDAASVPAAVAVSQEQQCCGEEAQQAPPSSGSSPMECDSQAGSLMSATSLTVPAPQKKDTVDEPAVPSAALDDPAVPSAGLDELAVPSAVLDEPAVPSAVLDEPAVPSAADAAPDVPPQLQSPQHAARKRLEELQAQQQALQAALLQARGQATSIADTVQQEQQQEQQPRAAINTIASASEAPAESTAAASAAATSPAAPPATSSAPLDWVGAAAALAEAAAGVATTVASVMAAGAAAAARDALSSVAQGAGSSRTSDKHRSAKEGPPMSEKLVVPSGNDGSATSRAGGVVAVRRARAALLQGWRSVLSAARTRSVLAASAAAAEQAADKAVLGVVQSGSTDGTAADVALGETEETESVTQCAPEGAAAGGSPEATGSPAGTEPAAETAPAATPEAVAAASASSSVAEAAAAAAPPVAAPATPDAAPADVATTERQQRRRAAVADAGSAELSSPWDELPRPQTPPGQQQQPSLGEATPPAAPLEHPHQAVMQGVLDALTLSCAARTAAGGDVGQPALLVADRRLAAATDVFRSLAQEGDSDDEESGSTALGREEVSSETCA